MKRSFYALMALVAAAMVAAPTMNAQGTGPDVIVGGIIDVDNYGSNNGTAAFALGTESCNIGNAPLLWQANNPNHPVIGGNLFRLKNGRFEQIGQSWLKHGFTALALSLCQPCQNPGTGALLGVGCSDPYTAGLNGSQSGLGPRSQVDASSGIFIYPPANPAWSGNIARRLQVKQVDLDPAQNAGAMYFGECQYVTADDANANNHHNNASWRQVNANSSSNISLTGPTHRMEIAEFGWKLQDPAVQINEIFDGSDGKVYVSFRSTDNGNGTFHYEFSVHNLNSHRSVNSFSVPFPAGATITNVGFHDVDYHSGDGNVIGTNYDGTDWAGVVSGVTNTVSWSCAPWLSNPNANAIRWGTAYAFRFDSTAQLSSSLTTTIGYYRPGTPATDTTTFLPVMQLAKTGGDLQAGNTGEAYPANLEVRLLDPLNNPVAGSTITWSLVSYPGGTANAPVLSSTTAVTDANGYASIGVTAGLSAGNTLIKAGFGPVEVSFSLYARQIRNVVTTTGVMVTSFNCEDPLAYFIYAYNIPTPPVTTPFGDVTTGIYPSLTGIPVIFDGVGAFGPANGSVRTNLSGAYTRVQTGLGALIGSGYTFVTQAYLVSYWPPRVSNTWTTIL